MPQPFSRREIIRSLIIWIVVFLILFTTTLALYIKIYSKDLLSGILTSLFQRKVTIGSLEYLPPFGIDGYNIQIGSVGKVKKVRLLFNFDAILLKKIKVAALILEEPVLLFKKGDFLRVKNSMKNLAGKTGAGSAGPHSAISKKEKDSLEIQIVQLLIKNGRIDYSDETPPVPVKLYLENIDLRLKNYVLPARPVQTDFRFTVDLLSGDMPATQFHLEGIGWADVVRRDLNGRVRVAGKNNEPFLQAELISKNNDMLVRGTMDINRSLFNSKQAASPGLMSFNQVMAGTLSSIGVDVGANFVFKTKMDDFRIDNISFSGIVNSEDNPKNQ